jgi:DNA-directed RNA polymerase subunit RPC12/RpoP
MIEFRCKNCGQKLSARRIHAGKKAKCPQCSNRISIPEAQANGAATDQGISGDTESAAKDPLLDLTLLDVSQKVKAERQPAEQPVPGETAYEQLRRLQGGQITQETDDIPQRKLPWIIDIFLYPISKPGLIMLGLIVLVPLFLKFLRMTFYFAMLSLPVLLIVYILVLFVSVMAWIVLSLYFYWYFCECIRESAAGQLRAPEIIGSAPGLWDMLLRLLRLLGCLAVFFAPVLIRLQYTRTVDAVFWSLLS